MSQKSGRPQTPEASDASEAAKSDTVLIHGVSEDGQSLAVLRARDDRVEAGIVRKVKDGEPLMGELLRLKPRPELPLLCDVEVAMKAPSLPESAARKLSHGGPAQVATASYRANWDAIWSKKPKSSAAN